MLLNDPIVEYWIHNFFIYKSLLISGRGTWPTQHGWKPRTS